MILTININLHSENILDYGLKLNHQFFFEHIGQKNVGYTDVNQYIIIQQILNSTLF